MSSEEKFDAIVVGGGFSWFCCSLDNGQSWFGCYDGGAR